MHSSAIDKTHTPTLSVPAQNQTASSSVAFADVMDKVQAERSDNAARTRTQPANTAATETALRETRSDREERAPIHENTRDDRDVDGRKNDRADEPAQKADRPAKENVDHTDKPKSAEQTKDTNSKHADDKPANDASKPENSQTGETAEQQADTSKTAKTGTAQEDRDANGDPTVSEALAAATQPVIASQSNIGLPMGVGTPGTNMPAGDGSSKDALLNSTALSQSASANNALQGDGTAAKTMQAAAKSGTPVEGDATGTDAKAGFEAALKQQGAGKTDANANANTGANSQNGNSNASANSSNNANASQQATNTNMANLAALQNAVTQQGATPATAKAQNPANAGVGAVDGANANGTVAGMTGQNANGTNAAATAQAASQAGKGAATAQTVQQQVAVHIKNAAGDGVDRISVQLRPEHLGRVDVKLEISHDGRVQTVVQADNRQTLDMLRQDVKGLQQALRDAGLNADSQSFTFEHRQDGGQGQNPHQQAGNSGRGTSSRPNDGDIISGAELAQHVAVGYGINSNGLVDIRI
ncbi:hypothetical protein TH25_14510 [Thalassospira profundimaris]|uniref:Flagellar hook-length control protein-like C-terminal domain-containing protein n=1 Tax=Thalassospira profundimaris TaxID=502049 RepID=A0A367X3M4_9PROT|nr:flagellar hook-length control protein FliK [Thalassospira profundimaris]RCK48274.1 hypothetical protein TH25_14510 [Thalassospira profundimaris]